MKRNIWHAFLLASVITAMGLTGGCNFNNVENASGLQAYFDSAGVDGCFGFYDNLHNQFTLYNKDRYLKRFPPGETFDLVTALTALETGKLFDEKTRIAGLVLPEALQSGSIPYFRDLAAKMGRDTMDRRVVALAYGNVDTTASVDSTSLFKALTISPDEQLGLIKKLYFNQLPYQIRTQEVMKAALAREQDTNYSLSYISGSALDSAGKKTGWALGWIEESRRPYFFVLNIGGQWREDAPGNAIRALLQKILANQGFFNGEK
jgi:beta-lactamase class D